MVGNAEECRERARQCLARARTAPTLLVMTKFESLAHSWQRLADELESLETVLRRLKKPERKAS
jgi:ribosome-interacting GTPase 1